MKKIESLLKINKSVMHKNDNKYKLYQDNLYNKEIIERPKFKFNIDYDINFLDFDPYIEDGIIHFLYMITKNISKDNLGLLYNNLNSINITNKFDKHNFLYNISKIYFNHSFISGYYLLKKNTIYIISKYEFLLYKKIIDCNISKCSYKDFLSNVLYHEMLHACSTFTTNDNTFSGFVQNNKNGSNYIGDGINEGYTELILNKLFDNTIGYVSSYNYEKVIAKAIEIIIGSDAMSKCFFDADLHGLVCELAKYSSYDDGKEFIINLDRIHYLKKENNSLEIRDKIIELSDRINIFIVNSYISKLVYDNDKVELSDIDIEDIKCFCFALEENVRNNLSVDSSSIIYNKCIDCKLKKTKKI